MRQRKELPALRRSPDSRHGVRLGSADASYRPVAAARPLSGIEIPQLKKINNKITNKNKEKDKKCSVFSARDPADEAERPTLSQSRVR